MRKYVVLILISISFLLTAAIPHSAEDPLHTLTTIATENHFPIKSWEVTLRESISAPDFNQFVNNDESSHFVAVTESNNSVIYDRIYTPELEYMEVEARLVTAKNNPEQAELLIVLKGTNWNEETRAEYHEIKKEIMQEYFTSDVQVFTCIELTESDIIEDRVVISFLEEKLGFLHKETQVDNNELTKLKNVIYGYTPLWDDEFTINGIPYNVQIASSEDEFGKWTYTIGTPILVNEY